MQRTKVDYIIVGQGLAGTWLSHELIKRDKSIVVINHDTEATSSKKAAGLYNPITGRQMVKTWRADDFFPKLETEYRELEKIIEAKFLYPIPIYRPFRTVSDQNDWQGKQSEAQYKNYLKEVKTASLGLENIIDPNGGIIIDNCGFVDLPTLLNAYKNYLIHKGIYHEEMFEIAEMSESEEEVVYKNWSAKKVLFCEGPSISSLWEELPFRPVRGEIIDIECDLASDYVINQGVFMIPKNGYFTVGSTYDHKNLTFQPQESGIQNIQERLGKIFAGKYRILDKRAGVRPASHDRRPYIGFHKNFRTLSIFNGFGTKGVSLTPYFAKHFVDVLEGKTDLEKEANVERVY